MDKKKLFTKEISLINRRLKRYLQEYCDTSNVLYGALKYAVFPGGKRIRPLLSLESCRACGGNINEALPAACAIELIHNFSLVHDDLPSMDDDDLRRGKPTCHKKFGEAEAVLAGDALLALAFEALTEIKKPFILRCVLGILSGAVGLRGLIGGQALDIKHMGRVKRSALRENINMLKTTALFTAALKSGALCASGSRSKVKKMELYGKLIGKAFQMRDDILDGEYKGRELAKQKKDLADVIEKAKRALAKFGKKGDNLRYITDSLSV